MRGHEIPTMEESAKDKFVCCDPIVCPAGTRRSDLCWDHHRAAAAGPRGSSSAADPRTRVRMDRGLLVSGRKALSLA